MKNCKIYFLIGLTCLILIVSCQTNEPCWQLDSPDKQLRVEICQKEMSRSNLLFYSVYLKKGSSFQQILDPSPLGIEREDARFVENLEFVAVDTEFESEETYKLVTGKKSIHHTSYNTLKITFKNKEKTEISLNFRAYKGGIAFRYEFPGKSEHSVRVISELTGFDFREGKIWAHAYDTITMWNPAYETYYSGPMKIGTASPWNKNGWAFPILVESSGVWMLVSEAGFDGTYGACHLQPECDNGKYLLRFAEQGEAEGYYENTSYSTLPWKTPWRFIAIGETLQPIVETSLPSDLSDPCRMDQTEWIVPGRSSWSWWSDSDSPQDYDRLVPFIDFAAEMGWEYSLVDANWNHMKNGTLEQLAEYAAEKKVGLLLWYNSGGKHNVVTEEPRDLMDDRKARRSEFERISNMGIKGIKVDFFQSDKQDIIKQYLGILEDAAEYKLLVNFHGCTLPKGWRRTWPNLLSMESVRGGESYKFASEYPAQAPSHLAILPFSRNAIGPMDYTTGGFSDNTYPHLTSYGFELALPVVFESGIMHHMDSPEQTMKLPSYALDFLKTIPANWDDTRFITGFPGKDVVIARRKGGRWYIGGINGEGVSKELTLDISTTGNVPEKVRMIVDGDSPRELQSRELETEDGKLTLYLKPYGGFAGYWSE